MTILDISKFRLPEMLNDSNGKTDAAKVLGFFAGVAAIAGFIIAGTVALLLSNISASTTDAQVASVTAVVDLSKELSRNCLLFFTAAAGLLAVDKAAKDKKVDPTAIKQPPEPES